MLFEREQAKILLRAIGLNRLYDEISGPSHVTGEPPPDSSVRPTSSKLRPSLYERGAEVETPVSARIAEVGRLPDTTDLIEERDTWPGMADSLEESLTTVEQEVVSPFLEMEKVQIREEQLASRVRNSVLSGAVLSAAPYEDVIHQWTVSDKPSESLPERTLGQLEVARAEQSLKDVMTEDWHSTFWPWPGALFIFGFILSLVWILLIPKLILDDWIWTIWSDPVRRSDFLSDQGSILIYNPGFFFCLAGLLAWFFLSSPLFLAARIARARRFMERRVAQRKRNFIAWAKAHCGKELDDYLLDEAREAGKNAQERIGLLRLGFANGEEIDNQAKRLQRDPLWLGRSTTKQHRAAFSAIEGDDWTKLLLALVPSAATDALFWQRFGEWCIQQNELSNLESANEAKVTELLQEWLNDVLKKRIEEVRDVLQVIQLVGASIDKKAAKLMVNSEPPLPTDEAARSWSRVRQSQTAFLELPETADPDQALLWRTALRIQNSGRIRAQCRLHPRLAGDGPVYHI